MICVCTIIPPLQAALKRMGVEAPSLFVYVVCVGAASSELGYFLSYPAPLSGLSTLRDPLRERFLIESLL